MDLVSKLSCVVCSKILADKVGAVAIRPEQAMFQEVPVCVT